MRVLCQDIDSQILDLQELNYLSCFSGKNLKVEDVWKLMDETWDYCSAGYRQDDELAVSLFYASPVWLLNGIFTECDSLSKQHRESISQWVAKIEPHLVVDFGGGYGSLARKIAETCLKSEVKIVEPYPKKIAKHLAEPYKNLEYISKLPESADIIVAQDVLEHVSDPLNVFSQLLDSTKVGGYVIVANCFYPVMKCHLPHVFHFRYSFRFIAPMLGCDYIGTLPGANHVQIFRKNGRKKNWRQTRIFEKMSYFIFPICEVSKYILKYVFSRTKE